MIIGLYTTHVPAIAPKIGLITHVVLYSLTKTPVFKGIFPGHYLYVLFVLFVFNILLQLAIGKFYPRKTAYVMNDAQVVDMTPWNKGKMLSIICILLMLCLYAVFSPLVLAHG